MATTQNICFDVLKHLTYGQLKQVTPAFIIENRSLFEYFFLRPLNKNMASKEGRKFVQDVGASRKEMNRYYFLAFERGYVHQLRTEK